jgi:hypothetical protein
MTHIENRFTEQGTYVFTVNTTFTPTAMKYHWTDEDGTVINSRTSVSVVAPSTATSIMLSGDDLVIADAAKVRRVLTVYGTFSGGSLPFTVEASVDGKELLNIS